MNTAFLTLNLNGVTITVEQDGEEFYGYFTNAAGKTYTARACDTQGVIGQLILAGRDAFNATLTSDALCI